MAITNRTELISAVGTFMVYDDVASAADTIIPLAEAVMNRDVRIREMESSQSYSSQSTQSMTLPTDFIEATALYENATAGGTLEYISPKMFWSPQDSRTGSGQPIFYTVIGEEILLSPTPDTARDYVLYYFAEVAPLTESNTTNVLLSAAPDLYLYATLSQGAMLIGDNERYAEFEAKYREALRAVQAADSRARHRPGARIRTRATRDGVFRIA